MALWEKKFRSKGLVNLCLRTIINNFNKYNLLFKSTSDDYIKRCFEFLQRKFSYEIVDRLYPINRHWIYMEDYIDLLLNKHLKSLETIWLVHCSWEKITAKIAEIGSNVEKLLGTSGEGERPWEKVICYMPNLKSLIMPEVCSGEILLAVSLFCPDVEEIDVTGSFMFSNGVKLFFVNETGKAVFTKLKKLCIYDVKIAKDDVKYLLQNLPSLEILKYEELPPVLYSMYKDLSSLDNIKPYKIVELSLISFIDDSFVDIRRICLAVCPHLKSLHYILSEKDNLDVFPSLSELEKLYINDSLPRNRNTSLAKINMDKILKAVGWKLTYLDIETAEVLLSVLVENCPSLKTLKLFEVDVLADSDTKPIFTSLSSLAFYFYNISKSSKAISLLLSSSEKLESLSVTICNLRYSEIIVDFLKCCECCPIEKLSFRHCDIDEDFVKEILLNCHTLSCLDITGDFKGKIEIWKLSKTLPNKPQIRFHGI